MKRTAILLVALVILKGAMYWPNEVRAEMVQLACKLQTDPNPFDPRFFRLGITKGWFDHKYAYQGTKQKKGPVKDHGHKLELLGLKFLGGTVFIEKLPKDKVRRRGRLQYYFKGQPEFVCESFSKRIP